MADIVRGHYSHSKTRAVVCNMLAPRAMRTDMHVVASIPPSSHTPTVVSVQTMTHAHLAGHLEMGAPDNTNRVGLCGGHTHNAMQPRQAVGTTMSATVAVLWLHRESAVATPWRQP